jgi:hypothetical protein
MGGVFEFNGALQIKEETSLEVINVIKEEDSISVNIDKQEAKLYIIPGVSSGTRLSVLGLLRFVPTCESTVYAMRHMCGAAHWAYPCPPPCMHLKVNGYHETLELLHRT